MGRCLQALLARKLQACCANLQHGAMQPSCGLLSGCIVAGLVRTTRKRGIWLLSSLLHKVRGVLRCALCFQAALRHCGVHLGSCHSACCDAVADGDAVQGCGVRCLGVESEL